MGNIFPDPNKLSSEDFVYVEGLHGLGTISRPPATSAEPEGRDVLKEADNNPELNTHCTALTCTYI